MDVYIHVFRCLGVFFVALNMNYTFIQIPLTLSLVMSLVVVCDGDVALTILCLALCHHMHRRNSETTDLLSYLQLILG